MPLESISKNILLSRERYSTIWGGASLLQMLVTSMNTLINNKEWAWDFIINLSESDFPIKKIDKLVDFLTVNKGKNFVKSHGREAQRFIQKQGLDKIFVECDNHMWRIGDRDLPNGIQIDGGSDWIGLSREFVEYITNSNKDMLLEGLWTVFSHTLLPAESYFHTVLRNSRFCHTYVDNNLHVTNWKRRMGCKCQYKHVVDWCGCSPNDFKIDDWNRIQNTESKQLFFARKFEPIVSQSIILKIEEWLFGLNYNKGFPNLNAYWQSLYDVKDNIINDETLSLISISKLIISILLDPQHNFNNKHIKLVTTYMKHDIYEGFLINFEVTNQLKQFYIPPSIEYELWASPTQISHVSKHQSFAKRIKLLEVSSDFDQKEQICRNFAKVLSPSSAPVLVIHIRNNVNKDEYLNEDNLNLTILWIDPLNRLYDVTEIIINDPNSSSINFSNLILKNSILLPGTWTVKVILKFSIVAQCNFLIMPNTNNYKQYIYYIDETDNYYKNDEIYHPYITNEIDIIERRNEFKSTFNQTPDLFEKWIKKIIKSYYKIKGLCMVHKDIYNGISNTTYNFIKNIEICKTTPWSSFSSDPKSKIIYDIIS